jgi:PAS domain S-box-containing protein
MADLSEVAKDPKTLTSRELRVPHKDGSWRTIEGRAANHLDNPHIRGILINFRDVTARRIVEDHLIDSERRYRALVETTNTGYVIVDTEGKVVNANSEYLRLAGFRDLEEICGRSALEWTAPHEKQRNAKAIAQCAKDGFIRNLEIDYVDLRGKVTPVEINATVVEIGGKSLMMSLCRDITERRKADEELRLHREITTRMSEGILLARADDQVIVYANPKAEEMFGAGPGRLIGANIRDFRNTRINLPGTEVEQIVAALRESGQWQGEVANCKRDGAPFWCRTNISTFEHPAFGPVFLSVHTDITERREAEDALRRSEAMLADAEHLSGIGSFDRDIPTNTVRRSEGFFRIFGVSSQEMAAEPEDFLRFVHKADRDRVEKAVHKTVAEGAPYQEDYRICRPDGTQLFVHAEGRAIRDKAGRPTRFYGWLQDITERRMLEEKVLDISDRERRNIGHDLHDDLGQQLTGIALLGRALQERLSVQSSPEIEAMAELLRHVDSALVHVRELARGLESTPPRPEGLLEALSGLAAHVRSTSKVSCRLEADRRVLVQEPSVANHLYRIAQEAVHNAVRHGRPRNITITLTQGDSGLELAIADNGSGMLESPKKGAGMGLDIMRHRAELIHGTLTIASQSGKGSEVICRISAAAAAAGGQA